MSVTAATFRADFTEFASASSYPTSAINYYLALAGLLLNQNRWGVPAPTATSPPTALIDFATELFVAHHIVLEYQAQLAARNGAPPGTAAGGPVSGKSVGPISVNYDTGSATYENAGFYNLTFYGTRFWNLVEMAGAGPVQFGVNPYGGGPFNGATAWLGPPVWPTFFWNT